MNKKTVLIGLGVLAVAGIGYYMWKKKSEKLGADGDYSNAQAGDTCSCTTCESTPSNPNQAPTVYAGACTPNLANQPYAGYHTVTQPCPCSSSSATVRPKFISKNQKYIKS